eukprot:5127580-Heterocapsa_arctica.AAC.1
MPGMTRISPRGAMGFRSGVPLPALPRLRLRASTVLLVQRPDVGATPPVDGRGALPGVPTPAS